MVTMSVKPSWPRPDPAAGGPRRAVPGAIPISPIDRGGPLRPRRLPIPVARDTTGPGTPRAPSSARRRATDALLHAAPDFDLRDPMLPAALRFAERRGASILPAPILAAWRTRLREQTDAERGAPWTLGFDALPNSPAYDTPDGVGALWRPRERDWLERDPTGFGHRLLAPIALAENVDFLAALEADGDPEVGRAAAEILRDIQPRLEADLADCIVGGDPWLDTFQLWLLVRRPHALARLHPLALAVATRYGTLASRLAGLVCGIRFPFEAAPLVSANAHLGAALWMLDYRPTLLAGIVSFVRSRRAPDGGFGDEGQPPDVLTTLAAADLLSTLDPTFDPEPTVGWFARAQEPAGWWRALDPEVPWLTAAVVEWLELAERPFGERFRWPAYQRVDLDRKTGIPGYVAFDRLARVFEALPGIATAPVGLAFCDLAGFRDFNGHHGQDMGDRVLRTFATALAEIDASLAIRDGGDEFLVVGAPGRRDLAPDIERFRAEWPRRFALEHGTATRAVAPRFVLTILEGQDLRDGRERLGRAISRVKAEAPDPAPDGVLRRLED